MADLLNGRDGPVPNAGKLSVLKLLHKLHHVSFLAHTSSLCATNRKAKTDILKLPPTKNLRPMIAVVVVVFVFVSE